jgi:hypothetical protein
MIIEDLSIPFSPINRLSGQKKKKKEKKRNNKVKAELNDTSIKCTYRIYHQNTK